MKQKLTLSSLLVSKRVKLVKLGMLLIKQVTSKSASKSASEASKASKLGQACLPLLEASKHSLALGKLLLNLLRPSFTCYLLVSKLVKLVKLGKPSFT